MPTSYRSMQTDGHEVRPLLGDTATRLGVRDRDLRPDGGNAHPGRGGMSVVSSVAGLRRRVQNGLFPPSMVPVRLNDNGKVPFASGNNLLHVFRIGQGPFAAGPITEELILQPDHDDHGTVQPIVIMPYQEYKQAIVRTRDLWTCGEEDD